MENIINKITATIKKHKRFLIISHDNLDGDSLGSSLAFAMALRKLGKKAYIYLGQKIPVKYAFLPGINELINKRLNLKHIDALIILDTACWEQMENINPSIPKNIAVINIDHHIDNKRIGTINWIGPASSATGELVYRLLKQMKIKIGKEIALCLYTAITTDTGSFQYSNTTSKTHLIVSQLLKYGISPSAAAEAIYENVNLSKLKLLRLSLKTLKTLSVNGITVLWLWITNGMMQKSGAVKEDTDGFIDCLKSIRKVKIAVVFKDSIRRNEIRVTFRSKDIGIEVNEIAHKFNGGGHPAAAGCTIYGKREEVETKVLNAVKNYLKQ